MVSPKRALLLCALVVAALLPSVSPRKILPKKMKVRGESYTLDKSSDMEMCRAVVSEMHMELRKFNMKEDGEDNIYETAGMAVCLGVVKNYAFEQEVAGAKWKMRHAPKESEEEEMEAMQFNLKGMFLLKEACVLFSEELQQEISEVMYRRVDKDSAEEIADDFCPRVLKQKVRKSHKYDPTENPVDPMNPVQRADQMQEFLRERDKTGAIEEMMRMESFTPERTLSEKWQGKFQPAVDALKCKVCQASVRRAVKEVHDLKTDPRFKDKWQRESLVAETVTKICHGPEYDAIEKGFYPTTPGNPPEWASWYSVREEEGGEWKLVRLSKPQSIREQPEDIELDEDGEAMTNPFFDATVVTRACRQVIDEKLSDETDLSAIIFGNLEGSGKDIAKQYCANACKEGGKEEL